MIAKGHFCQSECILSFFFWEMVSLVKYKCMGKTDFSLITVPYVHLLKLLLNRFKVTQCPLLEEKIRSGPREQSVAQNVRDLPQLLFGHCDKVKHFQRQWSFSLNFSAWRCKPIRHGLEVLWFMQGTCRQWHWHWTQGHKDSYSSFCPWPSLWFCSKQSKLGRFDPFSVFH